MKVVNAFIEPIIADAVAKKNDAWREKVSEEGKRTLLDHLVQVTSDPKILKDETWDFMYNIEDWNLTSCFPLVWI